MKDCSKYEVGDVLTANVFADHAALGAGNGAPNGDQAQLLVHLDHVQLDDSNLNIP